MKSRGFELCISRPSLGFSAVLKFVLLSSLLVLFLNICLFLYTRVSTRSYSNFRPQILKITPPPPPPPSPSPSSLTLSSPLPSTTSPPTILSPSLANHSLLNSIISNSILAIPLSTDPPIPTAPPSVSSSPSSSSSSSSLSSNPKKGLQKGCDLAKGEWVRDPNSPYYTNSTCWMIQEHQNCMKYGRPDLDFLKWRWKPDGCELPIMDPAVFLELVRGKSLAFIGDSLARNQMQSLMCLLSRVEYPKETSPTNEDRITRMFYGTHNFTLWSFWSPFLVRHEESNISVSGSPFWNLYLDEPDQLWSAHSAHLHYLVLSTGDWFSRPSFFHLKQAIAGCQYCAAGAAPFMPIRQAHRRAFRTALDAVAGGVVGGVAGGFRGVVVVRTVSPVHFEGGEWNRGGDCRRTGPFRRGEAPGLGEMEMEIYRDQKKEFWKAKWEWSERGVEFRLADITPAMAMRADGHPSKYGHRPEEELWVMHSDCVHWCLPGPVDMWNDFLFQVLNI